MANLDPLEDFSFEVDWGGSRIGMLRVSPLRWSTSVANYRDGSNPTNSSHKAPGLTAYDPVTLERVIVSGDLEFQTWASQVVGAGGGGTGYRRDIVIRVLNGEHTTVVVFNLKHCWPSAYEAISELNADVPGVARERLTVEYESFTRIDP